MTVRFAILGTAMAVLATGTTAPASARDGWSPGSAAAVGVLGGLAVGGALGAAAAQPYYPGRPVYAPPPPPEYLPPPPRRVYYEDDAPACYTRVRHFVDDWGYERVRRVRVCE